MSIFPEDRTPPSGVCNAVQIRLSQMTLHRPRQWGGCWLALELWSQLELDRFWSDLLGVSRKGMGWLHVLKTLVCYEAMIAFLESESFEDSMRNAVALGGDADTQAAIAGAIAEPFYGRVPSNILNQITKRLNHKFKRTISEFYKTFLIGFPIC